MELYLQWPTNRKSHMVYRTAPFSCMICPMVPFPVTLSDPGHGDALEELCAQLTRDLFAIAKFLFLPRDAHA